MGPNRRPSSSPSAATRLFDEQRDIAAMQPRACYALLRPTRDDPENHALTDAAGREPGISSPRKGRPQSREGRAHVTHRNALHRKIKKNNAGIFGFRVARTGESHLSRGHHGQPKPELTRSEVKARGGGSRRLGLFFGFQPRARFATSQSSPCRSTSPRGVVWPVQGVDFT